MDFDRGRVPGTPFESVNDYVMIPIDLIYGKRLISANRLLNSEFTFKSPVWLDDIFYFI